MKTISFKAPDDLASWLAQEARRLKVPKTSLIRLILQHHQQQAPASALDLAADLCGCVQSNRGDLARNKKYLKGFGR